MSESEGQRFDKDRKTRLVARARAMQAVIRPLLLDIIMCVVGESEADISQTTFNICLDQTLKNPKSACHPYFKNACGKSRLDLLLHEWNILITGITEALANQDVKIQFYNDNRNIQLDYTDVPKLVEKRFAAEKAKKDEADHMAKKNAESAELKQ